MAKPPSKKLIVLFIALALVMVATAYWFMSRGKVETDNAFIEAHIIPIAPKIAGYVVELNVGDNQHIKKGDIILRIDPRDYEVAVKKAQADLDSAKARLIAGQHNFASTSVSAPSNLASAKSQVQAATAEWNNASLALKRLQKLNDSARSRQSLENAIATEKQALSNLEDVKARLRTAETAPDAIAASEAAVQELQADVARAEADLEHAQNNLEATTMRASQDGRITRKNVEVGAYVQPGQQLSTLVGDDVWIIANYKETQLSGMKAGQAVDIEIDSYPGHQFHGKVDSIQSGAGSRFSLFPPENATGNFVKVVQRVPVKIIFDEPPAREIPLGPGMSVIPTVHIR